VRHATGRQQASRNHERSNGRVPPPGHPHRP